MNGPTILNNFLKRDDPNLFLKDLFSIHSTYTKCKDNIFGRLHKWWIEKVTYPYFRYRVYKAQLETANLLYEQPSLITTVISRYIQYLVFYTNIIKDLSINDLLYYLFGDAIKFNVRIEQDEILYYSIFLQSIMDKDIIHEDDNKISIVLVELDFENKETIFTQVIYDTDNADEAKLADILYEHQFILGLDGELSNPNYVFDKSLLEEDLVKYRLIISQIMLFLGGVFDETCKLKFFKISQNSN